MIQSEFADLTDWPTLVKIAIRLTVAAMAGALIGYEREKTGKAAGLRTHMLVTIGAALFVIVPVTQETTPGDMSRVIQGIATGIGFLGGGAILKLADDRRIKGLTTAAGIWMAAAIGIAAGFGRMGAVLLGTAFALAVLSTLGWMERKFESRSESA
jgi:putative Mg2+ transporter-C (MgtC) family protein